MTGRYLILQTKLKELESILNDALLRGPETHSNEDIKQKLAFIGNLLSAEVASHPTKPHHLLHISKRLGLLEKAFHEWDTLRTFSTDQDYFEKDSTCSCTESCLNDDGEALLDDDDDTDQLIVFDDPEKLFPDFVGEKAIVEFRGNNGVEESGENETEKINFFEDAEDVFFEEFVRDKELVEYYDDDVCLLGKKGEERKDDEMGREEGRGKSGFGKNCCAMAGGVVIGMVLMGFIMVNFSGCCFHYVEQASFAIPT